MSDLYGQQDPGSTAADRGGQKVPFGEAP